MKSFFSKKIVVGALVAATVCVSGDRKSVV